jgi:hypothetical protein
MLRVGVRVFLFFSVLLPTITCTAAFAAPELGSLTICKGVSGAELNPVDPRGEFAPDAAAIHAVARIKNGKPGAKITGTWISVDVISLPNYEIASSDVLLKAEGTVNAHFELS